MLNTFSRWIKMNFKLKNYYVDGEWFTRYEDAKDYSESMLAHDGRYRVVFTKAEMDSMVNNMVESVVKSINHELECGK